MIAFHGVLKKNQKVFLIMTEQLSKKLLSKEELLKIYEKFNIEPVKKIKKPKNVKKNDSS
jgi:hypothetical protein